MCEKQKGEFFCLYMIVLLSRSLLIRCLTVFQLKEFKLPRTKDQFPLEYANLHDTLLNEYASANKDLILVRTHEQMCA